MRSSKNKVPQSRIEIGDLIVYTHPTGYVYDVGLVVNIAEYGDAYDVEWYKSERGLGRYEESFLLEYVQK